MTDLEELWSNLDDEASTSPGLLLRRLPAPGFDVHLTQERPSRRFGFRVRVAGKPGALWKQLRSSQGIDVVVDARPGHDATLQITETDGRFRDVLSALVSDLLRALASITTEPADSPPTLDFLAAIIIRWQTCLQANRDGLSGERAAGLFGELTTLLDLLTSRVDTTLVLDRWTGPSGAIQDFQFDYLTIEVKTSRQTMPASVRISSERQLDTTTHERLVLTHYSLDERTDASGVTLPAMVGSVRAELGSGHAGLVFEQRLSEYGYMDLHSSRYSSVSYGLRAVDHYDVHGKMPRIVEDDLPVGVGRVSYDLSLAACEPYRLIPADYRTLVEGISA